MRRPRRDAGRPGPGPLAWFDAAMGRVPRRPGPVGGEGKDLAARSLPPRPPRSASPQGRSSKGEGRGPAEAVCPALLLGRQGRTGSPHAAWLLFREAVRSRAPCLNLLNSPGGGAAEDAVRRRAVAGEGQGRPWTDGGDDRVAPGRGQGHLWTDGAAGSPMDGRWRRQGRPPGSDIASHSRSPLPCWTGRGSTRRSKWHTPAARSS